MHLDAIHITHHLQLRWTDDLHIVHIGFLESNKKTAFHILLFSQDYSLDLWNRKESTSWRTVHNLNNAKAITFTELQCQLTQHAAWSSHFQ